MAISDVKEYTHLTDEQVEELGRELDAIREEIEESRGAADAAYINRLISIQRRLAAAGRVTLFFSKYKPAFWAGATMLGLAKILENMEIGHNVMHGQYDWTGDPELHSRTYEWDMACPGDDWRRDHNYEHHTFTNVLGKDRDVGYGLIRVTAKQRWNPAYAVQPISALMLALGFQWGVGAYGLRLEEALSGEQSLGELASRAGPFLRKGGWQLLKTTCSSPPWRCGTRRASSLATSSPTWSATFGRSRSSSAATFPKACVSTTRVKFAKRAAANGTSAS
jgi:linoleoyl-CoA desaturase